MCVCVCLFQATWDPQSEPNKHCAKMYLKHLLILFGHHCPLGDIHVVASQVQ